MHLSGMMAGLFGAFSTFMMKALASLSEANGIQAMQAINRCIVTPVFLLVFLGTGALCVVAALLAWTGPVGSSLAAAAAVVYVVGCLASTIIFNVPLNDRLDAVDADSQEGRDLWALYVSRWTHWNHVRAAATLIATTLLALAIACLR